MSRKVLDLRVFSMGGRDHHYRLGCDFTTAETLAHIRFCISCHHSRWSNNIGFQNITICRSIEEVLINAAVNPELFDRFCNTLRTLKIPCPGYCLSYMNTV
jgi:hypothetical protein